jgi:outer membrane protein OmpA-like peptidoglycan-associated protein
MLPLKQIIVFLSFFGSASLSAQTNFLLNGGFEDINVCTEYHAECGVEAWFYLKDVKAEMISSENDPLLGNNSFAIFYNWREYGGFTPVIGTILPCELQKGAIYIFSGIVNANLNARLIFKPGIALGEKFFVPKRPFSATMQPDSIIDISHIAGTNFYKFTYRFTATGKEKYLTFGSFIEEDNSSGKSNLTGVQVVSLLLDNFQLTAANNAEAPCLDFEKNKQQIYSYNFRHKEMDYSLFGKGELPVSFNSSDSNLITREILNIPRPVADTLILNDVLFDFNKAGLKQPATDMLAKFFPGDISATIDSIYIEGHTDSIGTDEKNLQLSIKRCAAVKTWLEQNQILPNQQIQIHPFGEKRPIASNSSSKGRVMNRRVELIIFRRKG